MFPRVGHGKRWSLDPTRALLDTLGNPHNSYAVIHVGGTNGKGSVATLIYESLRTTGHRVGLYTSPHLVDATERIVVNGRPISRDAFAEWTNKLYPVIESTDASHFEAMTTMALADFAARHVDIAVVEVGLGGRLDSTNVVDPILTVVTNVAKDHEEFLGSDLGRVAWEKASIAKKNVPMVVGEEIPALREAIVSRVRELGGKPRLVPRGKIYDGALGLMGAHQRRNAAVAWDALVNLEAPFVVSKEDMKQAFARAAVPGRLDWRGKWLLDVAHNQAGVEALIATLAEVRPPRPLHVVLGVLEDKPVESMVARLGSMADRLWLTVPPSAPPNRAQNAAQLAQIAQSGIQVEPSFDRALEAAQAGAETLVVTGSFYTVGDAMARLPGFLPFG